jgi:hypothetical protein
MTLEEIVATAWRQSCGLLLAYLSSRLMHVLVRGCSMIRRRRYADGRCRIHFERVFVFDPAANEVAAEDHCAQAAQHDSDGFEGNEYQHGFPPQRLAHTIYPYLIELFVYLIRFLGMMEILASG